MISIWQYICQEKNVCKEIDNKQKYGFEIVKEERCRKVLHMDLASDC